MNAQVGVHLADLRFVRLFPSDTHKKLHHRIRIAGNVLILEGALDLSIDPGHLVPMQPCKGCVCCTVYIVLDPSQSLGILIGHVLKLAGKPFGTGFKVGNQVLVAGQNGLTHAIHEGKPEGDIVDRFKASWLRWVRLGSNTNNVDTIGSWHHLPGPWRDKLLLVCPRNRAVHRPDVLVVHGLGPT